MQVHVVLLVLCLLPSALGFCSEGEKTATIGGEEFVFTVTYSVLSNAKLCVGKVTFGGKPYISKWMPADGAGLGGLENEITVYSDLLACGDSTSVKLKKVGPVGKEVAAFEYTDADYKNGEKKGKMFLMEYTRITVAMDVVARAVLGEVASQSKFESVTGLAFEKRLVTEALGLADTATNAAIFAELYRDYLLINYDLNKCGIDHHDFAMRNFLGTVKAVKSDSFDGDSMILSFDYDLSKKFDPEDMAKRKQWLFFNLNRPMEVYFAAPSPAVQGMPTFGLLGVQGIANLFPAHSGAAYVPATNAEALYRCSQIANMKPAQLKTFKITNDRPEAVKTYFVSSAFREYLMSIRTKTGGALDAELWAKCYGARTEQELAADLEDGEEFKEILVHN